MHLLSGYVNLIFTLLEGIVVTNDGNAILRELDLAHPAAKVFLSYIHYKEGIYICLNALCLLHIMLSRSIFLFRPKFCCKVC